MLLVNSVVNSWEFKGKIIFKIALNISLTSTFISTKWSVPFRFIYHFSSDIYVLRELPTHPAFTIWRIAYTFLFLIQGLNESLSPPIIITASSDRWLLWIGKAVTTVMADKGTLGWGRLSAGRVVGNHDNSRDRSSDSLFPSPCFMGGSLLLEGRTSTGQRDICNPACTPLKFHSVAPKSYKINFNLTRQSSQS
jgi:hypothetical protein